MVAIGIGSNAAIFSVVNGVLLRPLPYKDPERLGFTRADLHGETGHAGVAGPEIRDIRNQSRLIEGIGWMVVTAFTFGLSLISGVLFGLAPAFHAAKTDVNDALKQSGRSLTAGPGGQRVRTALIVAQVALSLVLLIGAGLMIRTFANMRRVDLGFDPANVLTFKVPINSREFQGDEKHWQFYKRALEAVRSQPGVELASGAVSLPLDPELSVPTAS